MAEPSARVGLRALARRAVTGAKSLGRHPRRHLAVHAGLLVLLLILVSVDLRGRLGFALFLLFLALHLTTVRSRRPPSTVPAPSEQGERR